VTHEGGCVCPPGKGYEGGTDLCISCTDGNYKEGYGNEGCTSCGTHFSTQGEIAVVVKEKCVCKNSFVSKDEGEGEVCVCPTGYGFNGATSYCEPCQPGLFKVRERERERREREKKKKPHKYSHTHRTPKTSSRAHLVPLDPTTA